MRITKKKNKQARVTKIVLQKFTKDLSILGALTKVVATDFAKRFFGEFTKFVGNCVPKFSSKTGKRTLILIQA